MEPSQHAKKKILHSDEKNACINLVILTTLKPKNLKPVPILMPITQDSFSVHIYWQTEYIQ